ADSVSATAVPSSRDDGCQVLGSGFWGWRFLPRTQNLTPRTLRQLLDAAERHRPQPIRTRADAHALASLPALLLSTQRASDSGVLGLFHRAFLFHFHGTRFN